ncbi:MAG: phosphoglycerate kinase [Alphaproteobacteria bacterium 41-28]|nr:MAG: phosphoglycerate kinase [Alphaproteobacteria bacterium 41-28]
MPNFRTLDDLNARGKRVLVRLDLNLPIQNGQITDLSRLERSLPTLKELSSQGAKVIVMAHLGRPQGEDKSLTIAPIAQALAKSMAPMPVRFCETSQGPLVEKAIDALHNGEILLLENIRFVEGEEKNDPVFAREMAQWGDIYVNDAFSTAHRAHVSTEGIAHFLPSYAGRLMEEELRALDRALGNPKRPLMAIVGGAKISTKLPLLENLLSKVDILVIGGAMANTFLAAKGYNIGASLFEHDLLETARSLLAKAPEIILPEDVVVARNLEDQRSIETLFIPEVAGDQKIFDIGPLTCQHILKKMKTCHTLLWNGPFGVFETPPFDKGTTTVAKGAAQLTREGSLLSVAGGGDTVAALIQAGVVDDFSYVSTAGGAFLEWLEGKTLPGVEALSSSDSIREKMFENNK